MSHEIALKPIFETKLGRLYRGDCLKLLPQFRFHIFRCVLTDLPYQNTDNEWDVILPFDKLWENYRCLCIDRAPIILHGAEPFASKLRLSNEAWYRHDIYWDKVLPGALQLVHTQPPRRIEPIMVFGSGVPLTFTPQKIPLPKPVKGWARNWKSSNYEHSEVRHPILRIYTDSYPTNYIQCKNLRRKDGHPTAKPVELAEYLLKTYSAKGDLILDHCAGYGPTLIAAEKLGRHWIGIEQRADYCKRIIKRFKDTF